MGLIFKGAQGREKRKRLAHIFAAFVILIHAGGHYDAGHHTYLVFLFAGLVFLVVALLHPIIEKKAPWIDGVFFIIEACLSFVVAYEFFHAGKKALPYTYLFLGFAQIVLAIVMSRKGIAHHKKNAPAGVGQEH